MSRERFDRLMELFRDAARMPPGDRIVLLEQRCPEDPELVADVLELLACRRSPVDDTDLLDLS